MIAQPTQGPWAWYRVGDVIDRFVAKGCVLRTYTRETPTFLGVRKLRYLHSPMTNGFINISKGDDDHILGKEVEVWERRLLIPNNLIN